MKRRVKKSTDFISYLPLSILHHILSYLSSEDSARTSVLSRKWKIIWKYFPAILEFKPPVHVWEGLPRFEERFREYLYSVDRSLQNYILDYRRIKRLNLDVTGVEKSSVLLVNKWLPLVLHNHVHDLKFNVSTRDEMYYPLPETTFTVNSLLLRSSTDCFLLEKLVLSRVCLTEKIVQDIIRNCPFLTDLNLLNFDGLKTLNISELHILTTLTVEIPDNSDELTSIIIVNAHSLKHFTFDIYNLRELDLRKSPITDAQFNLYISRLPLLEVLKIADCSHLRRIMISLQRLKLLYLNCRDFDFIEIDAPVLSEFCYVVTKQEINELPVLFFANAIHGSISLRINIEDKCLFVESLWFHWIREYLNVPFKSINLDIGLYNNLASHSAHSRVLFYPSPVEIGEAAILPQVEIDCLGLNAFVLEDPSQWETLLDGLLWSCHPKTVLMTADSSIENNCAETLCRMLNQGECRKCLTSSHCKCWRRRFKAATVESTGDIEFDAINVGSVAKERVQCGIQKGNLFSIPKRCNVTFRFDWRNSV